MRILVTNDDGINSPGLHALARDLTKTAHEIVVVAPDRDYSGVGASLGQLHPDNSIQVKRVELPDAPCEAWTVAGPPGLTVLAARLGAVGDAPEVVVSGINAGLNTGRSILHSGTVGAALTGQNFGVSGLAVSVATPPSPDEPWQWDTAAALAVEVLETHLLSAPPRSVLNLNVPAVPVGRTKGIRWARLAPFGAVRAAIADVSSGVLQFELTATNDLPAPDTDTGTVDAGYASLTTLVGITEAWPVEAGIDAAAEVNERIVPGAPVEPVHRVPDASIRHTLHRPLAAE